MLNIPLRSELLVDHLCMVMVLVDQLKINLEADKDGLLGRSCFNDDCKLVMFTVLIVVITELVKHLRLKNRLNMRNQ